MNEELTSPFDSQVGGSHYKDKPLQPIEYIMANNLNFQQGNIIKYASYREGKNGESEIESLEGYLEDLDKVQHYADFEKFRVRKLIAELKSNALRKLADKSHNESNTSK